MGARGPLPSPFREHVLSLARRGELATLDEAAQIAGVERATVHWWLRYAGIDWRRTRLHRIARMRSRAVEIAEGTPRRRGSKAELRAQGERATAEWRKRHRGEAETRD